MHYVVLNDLKFTSNDVENILRPASPSCAAAAPGNGILPVVSELNKKSSRNALDSLAVTRSTR
jgi:hypothetical protein